MDSNTYIANAIRTESVPAELIVDQVALHATLEIAIAAGKLVDQFKRRMYYNTPEKEVLLDQDKMLENLAVINQMSAYLGQALMTGADFNHPLTAEELAETTDGLPDDVKNFRLPNLDVRLTHASLGLFTEAAETVELIKQQYETGVIDRVGFGEEIGDSEWYQAIGFDASGVSEASCREKNIAKLQKRYPDKFSGVAATERDTAAERAVLEGQGA